jgi:hypothetical protein
MLDALAAIGVGALVLLVLGRCMKAQQQRHFEALKREVHERCDAELAKRRGA